MSITQITPVEQSLMVALHNTTEVLKQVTAERDALRADAESYRWIVKHAGWYRNDEDDFRDNWTKLAINVAYGADLSCEAMRRLAIENAMKGKS